MSNLKISRSGASRAGWLRWVDCLRGFAVLAVMIEHLPGVRLPVAIFDYFDFGIFGVTMFFCISGYIIPYSIRENPSMTVRPFILARLFRLYPAYWVSLALAAVYFHPSAATAIANLTMLQRFFGLHDVNSVYWTLQIEVIFYLCVVGLMLMGRLDRLSTNLAAGLGFAAVAVLMGAGRAITNHKFPLAPPIALTFMFFASAYGIFIARKAGGRAVAISAGAGAVLLVTAFALGYSKNWGYNETPWRFIISDLLAVGTCMIVSRLRFAPSPVVFIGRISYSLYLIYVPVIALMMPLEQRAGSGIVPLEFLVGIIAAFIMYSLVERPFVYLGRMMTGQISPPARVVA